MLEMKIVMVLVARKFDICGAFEERDRLVGRGKGLDTAYGDRAYQILVASAKPKHGMPMTVKKVV